ncbi:MAG: Sua5/YciO/YrdC/YwlC family protein [Chitinophagaceae bacterium]|nr:Sua5/YciO/YrdC/YwlC family protein [Oligoflexus sp.]
MVSIEEYAQAWLSGKVCLHPTDTVPGLSFNPHLPLAEQNFIALKARSAGKSPISLISSYEVAARCWQTLPGAWEEILRSLWPSALSVVWKASTKCPKSLIAADGTCGLRMPEWTGDTVWMHQLLVRLNSPFPSSSVNVSGEPSANDWNSALAFLKDKPNVFLPKLTPRQVESQLEKTFTPSTVIRLEEDGSWGMIREGVLSRSAIKKKWEQYAKRS